MSQPFPQLVGLPYEPNRTPWPTKEELKQIDIEPEPTEVGLDYLQEQHRGA